MVLDAMEKVKTLEDQQNLIFYELCEKLNCSKDSKTSEYLFDIVFNDIDAIGIL